MHYCIYVYLPIMQVMLYPMQMHDIEDFLVILDSQRKGSKLLASGQVVVPLFPQCGDILWIFGEERTLGQVSTTESPNGYNAINSHARACMVLHHLTACITCYAGIHMQ